MNIDEMQVVWDSQAKRTLFAFDRVTIEKLVQKEKRESWMSLKRVELAFILGLLAIGVIAVADTVVSGKEFFQLAEAVVYWSLAGWAFARRRRRERLEDSVGVGVASEVERAIANLRSVMQRGFDFGVIMTCVAFSSAGLRWAIYQDFGGSWNKLLGAALVPVIIGIGFTFEKRKLLQRERELELLREKFDEADQFDKE